MGKNAKKRDKKANYLDEVKQLSNHLLKLTELQTDIAMKLQVAVEIAQNQNT